MFESEVSLQNQNVMEGNGEAVGVKVRYKVTGGTVEGLSDAGALDATSPGRRTVLN